MYLDFETDMWPLLRSSGLWTMKGFWQQLEPHLGCVLPLSHHPLCKTGVRRGEGRASGPALLAAPARALAMCAVMATWAGSPQGALWQLSSTLGPLSCLWDKGDFALCEAPHRWHQDTKEMRASIWSSRHAGQSGAGRWGAGKMFSSGLQSAQVPAKASL